MLNGVDVMLEQKADMADRTLASLGCPKPYFAFCAPNAQGEGFRVGIFDAKKYVPFMVAMDVSTYLIDRYGADYFKSPSEAFGSNQAEVMASQPVA